ncbi:porin [Mesosutterella multiformis]|uniref:porin n=1 Tax=Mesosutterella multiformis TaxID=2259133 RepID=UPI000F615942|nr:porin [Mesosutterella multiformis]GCB32947.1 porin [Mesosutterella multiformis]
MKKHLIAAATLATFAGAAFAAPSVTLYGIVDTGLGYQHQKVTGQSSTDELSMTSSVNETSRWGLKGEEKIGNTTVSFNLADKFNTDDGTQADEDGRLFGREAQVSLSGRYGTLTAGRIGALGSSIGTYDQIFAVGDAFDGGDWDVFGLAATPVIDNSLTYQSPKFAGLQLTAQYSFKSNSKADGTEGRSSADRYAGAAVNYENGNFQAVLGYEFIDRSSLDSAPITKDGQLVTLGGNYNFEGVAQVFAMGQYFRGWDEVAGQNYEDLGLTGKGLKGKGLKGKGLKGWGAHLGTIVPVAGGDLTAGLYYVDGETGDSAVESGDKASADVQYYGVAVRYVYPLSKCTSVYAGASYGQSKVKNAVAIDDTKTQTTSVYTGVSFKF